MAYYLTIENKRGQYTPIDIDKSKYLMREADRKGKTFTLKEIDLFTMMFNDEFEMRSELAKEGLIEEGSTKPISIRIKRNGKYNKIMYDMFYQKDFEYIANPLKLISRINDKLIDGDYRFILRLVNHFFNYYGIGSTAPEVREFANASIRESQRSRHFDELDEQFDNPLVRMVKLLIYKHYELPNGRINYYYNDVEYRNLHAILAFVNNYDEECKKEQLEHSNNNESSQQMSLFEQSESKHKVRKLVKEKRNTIEGQFSLFDE